MPLLEHRRRPLRNAAGGARRRLILLRTAALRWWPPVWAAVFVLAADAGARAGGDPLPGWAFAGRAAALLPVALVRAGPLRQGLVWCAVAAAAAWWGQGDAALRRAAPPACAPAPVAAAVPCGWTGPLAVRTSGFAASQPRGRWRAPARVLAAGRGGDGTAPRRGQGVWLRGDGTPPAPGTILVARCVLQRPGPATVPGGFDLRRFLAGRGLTWTGTTDGPVRADSTAHDPVVVTGRMVAAARAACAGVLSDLLPPREARLALAVLLGWRTQASRAETADFTALGLAHLFAVSGLHVGILAGLLLLPAAAGGAGRGMRAALLAAGAAGFAVLTGAPGSVVRAGSVVALAAAAPACGRRAGGLRLLGVVFWAVVTWDPAVLLDTGLRLSYLAAGGIVLGNGLTGGFRCRGPRPLRAVAAGLGVSLSAQWATLPVVAGAFGRINAWSPLVNVVAVPVFGVGVWLLAGAAALAPFWAWGAGAVAAWGWLLVRLLEAGSARAAGAASAGEIGLVPPGPAGVGAWLAGTVVLAALLRAPWPTRVRAPLVAAVVVAGPWLLGPAGRLLPPRGAPVAVQFAVEQGDCGLVAFPDGWTALIDLADAWRGEDGPWRRQVAPWLRRQGVRRLDLVVLTHGHRDHTGGAAALARALPVGVWLGGGQAAGTVDTGPAPWLRPGPAVRVLHQWRRWSLEALDPRAVTDAPLHENDCSLVLVLRRDGDAVMVWSGDLERTGEAALLAAGLVPGGTAVWKAGHHGSDTSGSGPFLARLRPRTVLVSCGVGNRYRHPSHGPYVVADDTIPVVRTDLQGTVVVTWRSGRARVRPCLGGAP